MNWASVAAAPAPKAPAAPDAGPDKPRVAVVDANALITQHGLLNLVRARRSMHAPLNFGSAAAAAAAAASKPSPTRDYSASLPQVRFADKCVTTPEVLKEVRDKQSRQTLATLPFTIETREPDEDSVKAGGCCSCCGFGGC